MKKVKTVIVFLLLCCFHSKIYSQFARSRYYYSYYNPFRVEVGAGVGSMNCITDVGGANGDNAHYINELRLKNFKSDLSVYAGVTYNDFLGARLQATWGRIRSADIDIKPTTENAKSRQIRNLSFRSNIYEASFLLQFHPLMLLDAETHSFLLDPYAIGGVGVFSFNPQTWYKENWVNLHPLHTEGEGFPEYKSVSNYKLTQINVSVGVGVRYSLSSRVNLRLEYIHRILFTDYLDDVSSRKFVKPAAFDKNLSPDLAADAKALYNRSKDVRISVRRGNPNNNDTYMSLSIKIGFILSRDFRP